MFERKTHREFIQSLEIDKLQGQVDNANFDAHLARQGENKAEDRTLKAIEGLVNLRQNYDRLKRMLQFRSGLTMTKSRKLK